MLKVGDIFFVEGKGWISKIIRFITRGDKSHVGIMFETHICFEADGIKGKTRFRPLSDYQYSDIIFRRLKTMNEQHRCHLQSVCRGLEGSPYSYWDLALNVIAAPMPKKWRHKFTTFLGNKKFLKCDEAVMLVIHKVTGYQPFKKCERLNPSEMFKLIEKSGDFETVKIK